MFRQYCLLYCLFLPYVAQAMISNSFTIGVLDNRTSYAIEIFGFGFFESLAAFEKKEINVPLVLTKLQPRWESQELYVTAKKTYKDIKFVLEIDHGLNEFDDYHNDFVALKKILSPAKRFFKDAPTLAAWMRRNYIPLAAQNYLINIIFRGNNLENTEILVKENLLRIYPKENQKTTNGLDL